MKRLIAAGSAVLVLACLLSPTHAQYYGCPAYMPGQQPIMPAAAAMPLSGPMPVPLLVMMVPAPFETGRTLGPLETMPKEGPPVPRLPDAPAEPRAGWLARTWHKIAGK